MSRSAIASGLVSSALLSLGLSYGKHVSLVAIITLPLKPSCRSVSAQETDAAPGGKIVIEDYFTLSNRNLMISLESSVNVFAIWIINYPKAVLLPASTVLNDHERFPCNCVSIGFTSVLCMLLSNNPCHLV